MTLSILPPRAHLQVLSSGTTASRAGSHHLVLKYAHPNSTPKCRAGAAPCPMSWATRMVAAVPTPSLTVQCQPFCHTLTATVLCLGATGAGGRGRLCCISGPSGGLGGSQPWGVPCHQPHVVLFLHHTRDCGAWGFSAPPALVATCKM